MSKEMWFFSICSLIILIIGITAIIIYFYNNKKLNNKIKELQEQRKKDEKEFIKNVTDKRDKDLVYIEFINTIFDDIIDLHIIVNFSNNEKLIETQTHAFNKVLKDIEYLTVFNCNQTFSDYSASIILIRKEHIPTVKEKYDFYR